MFPACRTNLLQHDRLCRVPPVFEGTDLLQLLFCPSGWLEPVVWEAPE